MHSNDFYSVNLYLDKNKGAWIIMGGGGGKNALNPLQPQGIKGLVLALEQICKEPKFVFS